MKKVSSLILTLAVYFGSFAQAPQAFNYQTVVRNASGNIVSNQQVSLRFSVHDGSPSGTVVYKETQTLSTNQFGLVSLSIGTGSVVSGIFNTIAWGAGAKYLQVELDASGGSNYISMGTAQLISVPYALYAGVSGGGATSATTANTKVTTLSSSSARGQWVGLTASRITVQATGTYFVSGTFRAKFWTTGDICSGAIQNVTTNTQIAITYIQDLVYPNSGGVQGASSISQIVQLNQGDIIELDYKVSGGTANNTWSYGGDNDGWSTLSLFRLY